MQLNETLENSSARDISSKTQISKNNIEALLEGDFSKITKVKTMGFISIIEREYGINLSEFKKEALEFYSDKEEDNGISLQYDVPEETKEKSGLFKFIVILMIIYAVWYAFNNIDREKLNNVLPYAEEKFNAMINSGKELTSKVGSLDINKLSIKDNLDKKEDITENSEEVIEEPKEEEPISTEVEKEDEPKKDIYNNKVFNLSSVSDANYTNSENNKTY